MRTYTKVQNNPKQSKKIGDLTRKRWFVRVIRMFQPDSEKDIGGRLVSVYLPNANCIIHIYKYTYISK